uniref:Genome polyprotein n=1 Tax=Ranunculus mild mosaic virus TaxID=341111 RepID=A0A8D5TAG0_9POTV|nr:polyprotein [Ranunculus mild mosaic virus]
MASIMIGSITCALPTSAKECANTYAHPNVVTQRTKHEMLSDYSKRELEKYASTQASIWSALEAKLESSLNNRVDKTVHCTAKGLVKLKAPTARIRRDRARKARQELETEEFLRSPPTVITSLSIAGGRQASAMEADKEQRGTVHALSRRRTSRQRKQVCLSKVGLDNLIKEVARMQHKRSLPVEVIGKQSVKTYSKTVNGRKFITVRTHHEDGKIRKIDMPHSTFINETLRAMADARQYTNVDTDELSFGSSGIIIPMARAHGNCGRFWNGICIVRGRCDGRLFDARSILSRSVYMHMDHYSDPGTAFWRGFNRSFLSHRPSFLDHSCMSDFDVETCGVVAALVCQAILPCGRITCTQCADNNVSVIDKMKLDSMSENILKTSDLIERSYPQFRHVVSFLKKHNKFLNSFNTNTEAFGKIKFIIGERTDAPFSHILRMNEILIKGGEATTSELSEGTNLLLELARYHKNRTENIRQGSLQSFRNKVSAKAHVNTSLMCDNQLSKNGSFIWGERGYHAKRVFSNYFEQINPEDGYNKYIIRVNPNGSRKLAIGKLIVSTNFETLRQQMKGEPVEAQPITNSCVSKRDENFVYPCCCVTLDDGTPLYSDVKMPTKNHLIIGNSGESKILDLPTETGLAMYIAKDGYCYVNIFLSMLVNVVEEEAKSFTKMVRDVVVEKLGKWPSMLDVATACYLLTVFHPTTKNAELPRILVDHTTRTMHVIDSYGSLNTHYHVLKANTVSQLILFASDSLESELKHYTVGGLQNEMQARESALKLLIRSIYRPALMQQVLNDEPYLIILSVLSPGVLMALFNSGSLEKASRQWIKHSHSLAHIATMLTALATKVSLAKSLIAQNVIIQEHAQHLLEGTVRGIQPNMSYMLAITTLQVIHNRNDTDTVLSKAGYLMADHTTLKLIEKNYLEVLEHSWRELSLLEKFYATKESFHWRKHIIKPIKPVETADMKGRYDISPRSLLTNVRVKLNEKLSIVHSRIMSRLHCIIGKLVCFVVNYTSRLLPDLVKLVNVLLVFNLLLQINSSIYRTVHEYRRLKEYKLRAEQAKRLKCMDDEYARYCKTQTELPTKEQFLQHISDTAPHLYEDMKEMLEDYGPPVVHQSKKAEQAKLEQIIAFVALVLMMFDSERSDCVYRALTKLKQLVSITNTPVYHQSLDDICNTLDEKNLTIDFDIDTDDTTPTTQMDATFSEWWSNQLTRNHVIPHYRTEGHFLEFTRARAAFIANEIAHGTHTDILLRGTVGSGKSTGLPFHLSKKGTVLLLEPTRPLAENVCKQLRGDPFYTNPTLRMKGLSSFGSAPIHIMTSGYALHYLANNPNLIHDYAFILFDECHVHDSSAMAFRCLLSEYEYAGKIIKMSATPPGREVEFETQEPVKLLIEDHLSHQQFVDAQGSGANCDITSYGHNILVYVSSYNEVDSLSKMLLDKSYKVTKIDGRTMKLGNVEIQTSGSSSKKHFIVATNIIENGVTLDIDVVVDFGLKVVPILDVDDRMLRYKKTSISFGERIQRLGRVGRNKPGTALRIGFTEKGLVEIPPVIATEAAFLCFTYGLPVMTSNVSVNLLGSCTVRQARTMQQFELSPFYTAPLVRYDGTMHSAIYNILKVYKLRDSETVLNKLALPCKHVSNWLTARDYQKVGAQIDLDDDVRIPFYTKEVPNQIHGKIWQAIQQHKADACIGRITSAQACKIAYTLQTDVHSIPRTVQILDALIASEMTKQAHFRALTGTTCSTSNFSLMSIVTALRSKYAKDYTTENIAILQAAKAQLLEFKNTGIDASVPELLRNFGYLGCVQHQSKSEMATGLCLKGQWNTSLITQDILIILGIAGGGAWMLYSYYKDKLNEKVFFQGEKRQQQKLRFRKARDNKQGREVYGDDGTIEHFFGAAYTEKGKSKGRTKGMGTKTRRFVNMYGYDPSDYSFIRFVDPLTGYTKDENVHTDIHLVQEYFGKIRQEALEEDSLDSQQIYANPKIQAYIIKDLTSKALMHDLTPHNPLRVCDNTSTIAGFPEREFELRQTGRAVPIAPNLIPKSNEKEEVGFEGKSLFKGVRDYNPIASIICQLTNEADGYTQTLFGLGYGSCIVTNQHLFRRNNGTLTIKSHHGEFTVKNTTTLKMLPCDGRDILVIQLPKDFPPFPQKLNFRQPEQNEKICMVGSNFQNKHISSLVSESSAVFSVPNSHFWSHWVSTKDGHCGLPMGGIRDGSIIGIHSLSNFGNTKNYFASFPENFQVLFLDSTANVNWIRHWKYNTNLVCWGPLKLQESKPDGMFKISKLVTDIEESGVYEQGVNAKWMYNALNGNLKAVAQCRSQLVTKHVVKGKCQLFETYLNTHPEEKAKFQPLMGAYQKSRLNKEAYIKDIMKYATPIRIGEVDCAIFEKVVDHMIVKFLEWGFGNCHYITDEAEIFASLNMKAAVGALYSGKKKDYFAEYTNMDKAQILYESCYRLFSGKMGIWNGSLKSELRPLEKVELNKTRTFTAAPIDTLLGGKVCVDDFNNFFYSQNIVRPWSVGMTKFYGGWDELLTKLPDGWIYCDADGSQFDSSLSPYLINAVLQLRLACMEKWEIGEQMLSNLYTEIIYTPISTPDGTIVKKFKGNNSGQPSTVVDNTLMVMIAMHYALTSLGVVLENQDSVCKFFVNGDDLIIAMKPGYEHIYDGMAEKFSELGLNYTFTSRTTNRKGLWFMSHRGMERNGILIPKLEEERIVSILEWDRSDKPEHRLEAICASMIEAWGYDWLVHEIRKFYSWVLSQAPYNTLATEGKAPYIAETALEHLYTKRTVDLGAIEKLLTEWMEREEEDSEVVFHQANDQNLNAGQQVPGKQKEPQPLGDQTPIQKEPTTPSGKDKDVNVGTVGTFIVPRLNAMASKLSLPSVAGRSVMNLNHLLTYSPQQVDLSNTRSTKAQFATWYEGVKADYDVTDEQMAIILNGLMVWCLENGTSPNISGMWVMMEGEEQIEFPIKPLIDHAKPTFRQIMAHFSNVAEAYIEKRNYERPYMPRYGLQRNLTDMSLARYAFDFYEMTAKTPIRAREAHIQMKAAALRNANTRMFGLDGNVSTQAEDTERHTTDDVNRNMHTMLGVRNI